MIIVPEHLIVFESVNPDEKLGISEIINPSYIYEKDDIIRLFGYNEESDEEILGIYKVDHITHEINNLSGEQRIVIYLERQNADSK